jgi:hypothetical protein
MADADNPITVLENARAQVESARRELTLLRHRLGAMNATAKEVARSELCTALIRRLEIAEKEFHELEKLM